MAKTYTLLPPSEASSYGMITAWNRPSTEYDGTSKVLAIPNYLGNIRHTHSWIQSYADVRPQRQRTSTSKSVCWNMSRSPIRKRKRGNDMPDRVADIIEPDPPFIPPDNHRSPIHKHKRGTDVSDIFEPTPGRKSSPETACPPPNTFFSPDIANGALDGAAQEEFTGMRAEFTSKAWFDSRRGKLNRRLYSWYGYHGGNMSWHKMLTLITKVHFPSSDPSDWRIPTRAEREDRTKGVRLTKLEKCLVTKMFYTTGLTFSKLADLWGCNERTISRAIQQWNGLWKEASARYCRLRVFPEYLKACQPEGWSNRYKRLISHMSYD